MATKGTVSGVIANMVTLVVDGPVAQNEICYISTGGDRLMAEVIKVVGTQVYVQVFESTRGLKVGAEAEFTGHMLEVTLGPGMLSKNYDGLQNDLDKMDGVFLKRDNIRIRWIRKANGISCLWQRQATKWKPLHGWGRWMKTSSR